MFTVTIYQKQNGIINPLDPKKFDPWGQVVSFLDQLDPFNNPFPGDEAHITEIAITEGRRKLLPPTSAVTAEEMRVQIVASGKEKGEGWYQNETYWDGVIRKLKKSPVGQQCPELRLFLQRREVYPQPPRYARYVQSGNAIIAYKTTEEDGTLVPDHVTWENLSTFLSSLPQFLPPGAVLKISRPETMPETMPEGFYTEKESRSIPIRYAIEQRDRVGSPVNWSLGSWHKIATHLRSMEYTLQKEETIQIAAHEDGEYGTPVPDHVTWKNIPAFLASLPQFLPPGAVLKISRPETMPGYMSGGN